VACGTSLIANVASERIWVWDPVIEDWYSWFVNLILHVSKILAFIVKGIDTKILFSCLVGWVDSSTVEIKKN